MEAIVDGWLGLAGVAIGGGISYLGQWGLAARTRRYDVADRARQREYEVADRGRAERLQAASELPAALLEYRHTQIARRKAWLKTGAKCLELDNDVRLACGKAWEKLYRFELLVDDEAVRNVVYSLMGQIRELKTIEDPEQLDMEGVAVHRRIQKFIRTARVQLGLPAESEWALPGSAARSGDRLT